jgi:hypothetical protein
MTKVAKENSFIICAFCPGTAHFGIQSVVGDFLHYADSGASAQWPSPDLPSVELPMVLI